MVQKLRIFKYENFNIRNESFSAIVCPLSDRILRLIYLYLVNNKYKTANNVNEDLFYAVIQ